MASFINKLKTTVSEVLPGNPLSGEFDICATVIGSAGPGLSWKIYNATKKTTKQAASVFVFEKKSIEKFSKEDKKVLVNILKRGVQQLTRLRHPKVLSVIQPLEENRECLAFSTEPVLCSLANVLQGSSSSSDPEESALDDVEIKYGLLQVTEALSFLHNDGKLVHGNLTPASIILNDKKMWKLSGFDFAIGNSGSPPESVQYVCTAWISGPHDSCQPSLDYLAPEWGVRMICDPRSDLFSLAVIMHALYNHGKPVFQSHGNYSVYKQHVAELSHVSQNILRNIPDSLKQSMRLLLSPEPSNRPVAKQLMKLPYFEDIGVLTLAYLDSLVQRDNLQKSQYFRNLPSVLRQLPISLCLYRVLPTLFSECANKDMIPFALQNILVISERANSSQYARHILEHLIPILAISQPIQIPLMLLRNMQLLLQKTDEYNIRMHILPIILRSLDVYGEHAQLQELCMNTIPSFAHLVDKNAISKGFVPRIKNLCYTTANPSMRSQCMACLSKLMQHMDKWFVLDDILPFLNCVKARDPGSIMGMLGIYKLAFKEKHLGMPKDYIATKALPFLLPLSVDHSLNKEHFKQFIIVIQDMMREMEREHLAKLDQNEKEKSNESRSPFSDGKTTNTTNMQEFLSSAGLGDGNNGSQAKHTQMEQQMADTRDLSAPTYSRAKPTSVPMISKPPAAANQVRDLTSTLTGMSFPTKSSQQASALQQPQSSSRPNTGWSVNSGSSLANMVSTPKSMNQFGSGQSFASNLNQSTAHMQSMTGNNNSSWSFGPTQSSSIASGSDTGWSFSNTAGTMNNSMMQPGISNTGNNFSCVNSMSAPMRNSNTNVGVGIGSFSALNSPQYSLPGSTSQASRTQTSNSQISKNDLDDLLG